MKKIFSKFYNSSLKELLQYAERRLGFHGRLFETKPFVHPREIDSIKASEISEVLQRKFEVHKTSNLKGMISEGFAKLIQSRIAAILGIMLLLALTAQIPMALAGETNQEYRERRDREWYREQEFKRELDQIDKNYRAPSYHAIAFSKSTSRWGCAYGRSNRAIAEREALSQCQAPDAKVLCWAKGSWYCALADGPKSYGGASGETAAKAEAKALKFGNDIAPGCRIILLVGGDPPIVKEFK